MATLNLNKVETQLLIDTIETALSRLTDEIAHTDTFDYREMLKQRKDLLQKLRGKLH